MLPCLDPRDRLPTPSVIKCPRPLAQWGQREYRRSGGEGSGSEILAADHESALPSESFDVWAVC